MKLWHPFRVFFKTVDVSVDGEDVEVYTAIQELDVISLTMIGLHDENETVIWIEQDGKRYTQKEICEAVKEITDLRLRRIF